jgi:nitronate monooxygenase
LGGDPSRQVGAFYGKTMAIADMQERLAFLNRGQSWGVRKLRDILPRIDDVPLRTEIFEMLRAHESNINLAVEALNRP